MWLLLDTKWREYQHKRELNLFQSMAFQRIVNEIKMLSAELTQSFLEWKRKKEENSNELEI